MDISRIEIATNRSLLVFSVLLILLGFGSGVYYFSVFGFFLLIPALLPSPRPRQKGPPTGSVRQPVRRTSPQPVPPQPAPVTQEVSTPASPQSVAPVSVSSTQVSQFSYTPSLFPTSMFPAASQPVLPAQPPVEKRGEAPGSRDELLELGAIVALIRLALG